MRSLYAVDTQYANITDKAETALPGEETQMDSTRVVTEPDARECVSDVPKMPHLRIEGTA
jgi:hypothetical protein